MSPPTLAAAAAFAASFAATPVLRDLARRLGWLDRPNERSSHVRPTPRSGGIGILLGIALALVLGGALDEWGMRVALAGALVIAALGLLDDVHGFRAWPKLALHVLTGLAAVLVGGITLQALDLPVAGRLALGVAGIAASLVWIVWAINCYNFMDGINGLAAFQAVAAGAAMAVLFARRGDAAGAAAAAGIAGAAAGFLPWNFPRASAFMGDVGSTTLGFLFAVLALRLSSPGAVAHLDGVQGGAVEGASFVAAILPLFPFLFDASLTVLVRMWRGEKFFSTPHKLHVYQRLLRLGWTHARVTLLFTALAAACAFAAVSYERLDDSRRLLVLAAITAVHAALAVVVIRRTGEPNGTRAAAAIHPIPSPADRTA
ncbi:MAG TPA: glycosyltransferase family 4 protein [Longimicrobium sp.]|nr:glycosyltransferase family 4 protein [Longimicrobium sp.]